MKLKQQPNDFIVEELPSKTWSQDKQAHAVYRMEKQDIDTFDAIRAIARRLHLPHQEIGYAGLKDKHAKSTQYITLPTHCNIETMRLPGIEITRVGYLPNKIQIGDLTGNAFIIVVRDLHDADLDHFTDRVGSLRTDGVPNYFDSQRFGSVIDGVFIARLLIQGKEEAAVKQVLTAYQKSEQKAIKDEKRRIATHWYDLEHLKATDRILSHIITEYTTTHSWQQAYLRVPAHLREIHANAYQSYLWNETLKRLLQATIDPQRLLPVDYAAGTLLFPTHLTTQEKQLLPQILYTPSETALYSGLELAAFKKTLTIEGITQTDLARLAAYDQYLKARPRDTIILPTNLTSSEPQPDDLNTTPHEQRWQLTLSFSLPKGSYATIVTKRLFGH